MNSGPAVVCLHRRRNAYVLFGLSQTCCHRRLTRGAPSGQGQGVCALVCWPLGSGVWCLASGVLGSVRVVASVFSLRIPQCVFRCRRLHPCRCTCVCRCQRDSRDSSTTGCRAIVRRLRMTLCVTTNVIDVDVACFGFEGLSLAGFDAADDASLVVDSVDVPVLLGGLAWSTCGCHRGGVWLALPWSRHRTV